jgi:DNA-binding transcriptional regulator LsrR (DeoR family)
MRKNNTPLLIDKIISEEQFLVLKKLGAIGEINGLCFDLNGNKIKTPNDYLATTVLPNAKTNKPVIAISGGSYKAKAVKAAIEGGLINGLITDEDTVKKILNG